MHIGCLFVHLFIEHHIYSFAFQNPLWIFPFISNFLCEVCMFVRCWFLSIEVRCRYRLVFIHRLLKSLLFAVVRDTFSMPSPEIVEIFIFLPLSHLFVLFILCNHLGDGYHLEENGRKRKKLEDGVQVDGPSGISSQAWIGACHC